MQDSQSPLVQQAACVQAPTAPECHLSQSLVVDVVRLSNGDTFKQSKNLFLKLKKRGTW